MLRLWGFIGLLLGADLIYAGSVIRVKKRKSVVVVNIGRADGVTKDTRICIYKLNGDKVACGYPNRVKKHRAFVQVPKKRIAKVRKGMKAHDGEAAESSSSIVLMGGYIHTYQPASNYNRVEYPYVEGDKASDSAWNAATTAWPSTQMFELSLGAEMIFPIAGHPIAFGGRFRQMKSPPIQSDYSSNPEDRARFVEVALSEQTLGFWAGYYFLDTSLGDGLQFRSSAGLDLEMASVNITVTNKHDDGSINDTVYAGTASITVISAYANAHLAYMFGSVGLYGGMKFYLPFVGDGPAALSGDSAFADDTFQQRVEGRDVVEDLGTTLNLNRSSYGIEFPIGLILVF